jgi:hypothetical protein
MTLKLTVPNLFQTHDPNSYIDYEPSEENDDDLYLDDPLFSTPYEDLLHKVINTSKDLPYNLTQCEGDFHVTDSLGIMHFDASLYWMWAASLDKNKLYTRQEFTDSYNQAKANAELRYKYNSTHDLFFEDDKFVVRERNPDQKFCRGGLQ